MSSLATPTKKAKFDEPTNSPWKTPSKGKSTDVKGFILLVSYEQILSSNNNYFDVIVQQTKTDIITIRVMPQKQPTISRDLFIKSIRQSVVMEKVFIGDDMRFYKPLSGSTHRINDTNTKLSFKCDSYGKFTSLLEQVQPLMNVQCMLKYIGTSKLANNGSRIRNCVLYSETDAILTTIWNPAYFKLPEDKMLFIGGLVTEEYFGVQAKMLSRTYVMESTSPVIPIISKSRLAPLRLRAMGVTNATEIEVPGLIGASFSSAIHCTAKDCRGVIKPTADGGKFGKCSVEMCKTMVNVHRATHIVCGELQVTDEISLSADAEVIDSIFGDGVALLHRTQPEKITEKFLDLEDITVSYDNKTKKLLAIQHNTP